MKLEEKIEFIKNVARPHPTKRGSWSKANIRQQLNESFEIKDPICREVRLEELYDWALMESKLDEQENT